MITNMFLQVLDAVKGTERILTKNQSLITLRDLIPGRLYHISVQTILRGVAGPYSPPLELRTGKQRHSTYVENMY